MCATPYFWVIIVYDRKVMSDSTVNWCKFGVKHGVLAMLTFQKSVDIASFFEGQSEEKCILSAFRYTGIPLSSYMFL